MIEVVYDGNLGNNLFQYCFGRILANQLGYALKAPPIPGFPGTYDLIEGADFASAETRILRGQRPDMSFLGQEDPQYHILVTGYFQRYEYYQPYRKAIRKWLRMEGTVTDAEPGKEDVVVGIRRGRDYIPRHGLPLSYFEAALASTDHDRVFICTDVPNDPLVKHVRKRHGAVVRTPGALDNLLFIRRFQKIVISNSTFLWWAAYLSNATEIVFPRPANGFWSDEDCLSKNISLEVDEPRYRYIDCERYRSEFLSERLANARDDGKKWVRASAKRMLPGLARSAQLPERRYVFNEDFEEDLCRQVGRPGDSQR